jgi:hypothetical protein
MKLCLSWAKRPCFSCRPVPSGMTAALGWNWRPPRSLFVPWPSFFGPSGEQHRKSRALVVIAATNPQFAADPTLAVFKNDMERPYPPRRLFDGHFVASLYVQFVPWTPGQESIYDREQPTHFDADQTCPIPDRLSAPIVRYAAKSLLSHSSRYTADCQATQRRRISRLRIKSLCFVSADSVSADSVSPKMMSRATDTYSQVQIASERSRRGRFLFRSILNFSATPLINVLFFPCEVE